MLAPPDGACTRRRQRNSITRTPSVGLPNCCHSQAKRHPHPVHERSHMRLHANSAPAPRKFAARLRMHAMSAPALQDFRRRHATLVLSLLPRPLTNRMSLQPSDLAQPLTEDTLCPVFVHRSRPAADGNKHLKVCVVRGFAYPRSRASPIGNTWHSAQDPGRAHRQWSHTPDWINHCLRARVARPRTTSQKREHWSTEIKVVKPRPPRLASYPMRCATTTLKRKMCEKRHTKKNMKTGR